jgi:hypothetical protein
MTEERLKKIEESIQRIERGLFGDEELGQLGLVSRTNNHAGRIKRLERLAWAITVAMTLGGMAYKVAVDWWPKK